MLARTTPGAKGSTAGPRRKTPSKPAAWEVLSKDPKFPSERTRSTASHDERGPGVKRSMDVQRCRRTAAILDGSGASDSREKASGVTRRQGTPLRRKRRAII